jgi:hypothetical protein
MNEVKDLQDYVLELEDDIIAIQRELLDLNAFVAMVADVLSPGMSERFAEHMRFIREASADIQRIKEGDA